jgi:hypothetical protein
MARSTASAASVGAFFARASAAGGQKKRPAGGPAGRQVVGDAYADFRTLDAWSPFGPLVTSNSTLSPSAKLLKPWA